MNGTIELKRPDPNPEIVDYLERTLALAREGRVQAIAIAAHLTGGETAHGHALSAGADIAHLYLAIERVKLALLGHEQA